jgi:hypothetical protein
MITSYIIEKYKLMILDVNNSVNLITAKENVNHSLTTNSYLEINQSINNIICSI